MEGGPGLQHLQGRLLIDGRDLRDGGLFTDHDVVHAAQLGGVENLAPWIAGGRAGQLGHRHGIIGLVRIALLDPAPADLGDAGFERDHGLGHALRARPADQLQHLADIGLVLGLLGGELGLQIVVSVRQAQAVLAEIDRITVRILGVRADVDAEQRTLEGPDLGLQHRQPVSALDRGDGGQVRPQRLVAQGVDATQVHEGVIERTGLDGVVGLRAGGGLGALQYGPDVLLGDVGHDVVQAITRLVRGDFQGREEPAVGVGPEVVTRLDAGVLALGVEAPGPGADHRIGRGGVGDGGGEGGQAQDGAGEQAGAEVRHRGS